MATSNAQIVTANLDTAQEHRTGGEKSLVAGSLVQSYGG
jgi:hypothetical protein